MTDGIDRRVAVDRLRSAVDAHPPDGDSVVVAPEAVAGRTVAGDVTAPVSVPERPFATMDGFALVAGAGGPRPIVNSVAPADDPDRLADGTAVRVATGAPLPDGADAVVPVEEATVRDGRLVAASPPPEPGANLFPAGGTAAEGEVLFASGDRLSSRHAALLCDLGIERVAVEPLRDTAVLATGTEIARGVQPDRDSAMLAGLLRGGGCEPTALPPVPDDRERVAAAVARAAAEFDLVITAGGTSVGAGDHVGDVLADHDPLFDGIALRPGSPATVAVVDETPVCALPGKPLAAHTVATLVLRPALAATPDGRDPATVPAVAATDVDLPDEAAEYAIPVDLADGQAVPIGQGDGTSALYGDRFRPGRVASSTRATLADGVVIADDPLVAGEDVRVVPYGVIE